MSTVITVANNTGFTSVINPFLPITHLFKKQNILSFLAAKQTKTFTKQISRNIKTIYSFIVLKILCLFHSLRNNWYHKCFGTFKYVKQICKDCWYWIGIWHLGLKTESCNNHKQFQNTTTSLLLLYF